MQVREPCRARRGSDARLGRWEGTSAAAAARCLCVPDALRTARRPPSPGAGFHSYVQDVAPRSAGLVLAITNTCGTLVGIAGNLLTGYLAASRWGYAGACMGLGVQARGEGLVCG